MREQLKHRRIVEYEKVKVKTAMNNFSSDIHSGIYYKQNNKSTHILSKIYIMSDGYNAYVFIGDELKSAQFKDTVHQVCRCV